MDIPCRVVRGVDTPAAPDAVYALLADIPRSVAHFPDVESVVPEGDAWVWRLRRAGAGPLTFQVVYGARYRFDAPTRDVRWDAVPGVGNTRVDGRWIVEARPTGARFTLDATFVLSTPFPRPLRAAVEVVVQRENERLIGAYLANLATTLAGGDGRARG